MENLKTISKAQIKMRLAEVEKELEEWGNKGLKLDLTRGKPGKEQLDISTDMLDVISSEKDCFSENGFDCRNYGILDGIPEAKKLFSELLSIPESRLIICGNSSLNLMFDTIARAMLFGVAGGSKPWGKQENIKFLCPSPGYDRHFAICEAMGIEMISIKMTENGPDMDAVERLVSSDASIKGIWCVPKFSNPEGVTYSNETVRRFAALKPAADDFRIFWDNAYAVHELYDEKVELLDIFSEAEKNSSEDMIFYFASTSKITFPGSGVAIMAASEKNIAQIKNILATQTIGFDKINQMRHVKYFKTPDGIHSHMKKHAEIIRPKFDMVIKMFRENLSGISEWTEPRGGYFIDLSVPNGCAKKVFQLAGKYGVALTNAGASYPYGIDPLDKHLRIAPTFPSLKDLEAAVSILCLCVKKVVFEKELA